MLPVRNKFWCDPSDPFDDDSSLSDTENTKRRRDSFDDEEDNIPPPSSPSSPLSNQGTPTKKVARLIEGVRTWDTAQPLASPQKRVVRAAMEGAKGAPDTPNRRKQARLASSIVEAGLARVTDEAPYDPESPRYHKSVVRSLHSSGWAVGVIGDAAKIARGAANPVRQVGHFVNLGHIATLNSHDKKISGCHWLAPDDELRNRIECRAFNPETGVHVGFIRPEELTEKPKFSSFFPDTIRSEAELIRFIQQADTVYECENVQIRRSGALHFTCYIRTNELEIRSAFPHFVHEQWEPNRTYKITPDCRITSQDVLEAYKRLKNQKPSPVQMILDDVVVLDIAQGLPTKDKIPMGVYFIVPARLLHRL